MKKEAEVSVEQEVETASGFIPLYMTSSTGKTSDEENTSDQSDPVAQDVSEEALPEEEEELSDAMRRKIRQIEERERNIATILAQLEKSYTLLSEREAQLNHKEEVLNREYLKILELENLYKGMDKFSNSLNSVLPSLNTEELDLREVEAKRKED